MRTIFPLVILLSACSGSTEAPKQQKPAPEPVAEAKPEVPAQHTSLFKPLEKPTLTAADTAKVDLGRMLYYETRLSATQTQSCNTCHQLDNYGVDGEPTSPGVTGGRGERNSPTSYNAFLHVAQFWDGRAATVEEQAKGPILNPGEMAMAGEKDVEAILSSIPGYVDAFSKAFPEDEAPITYDNMANAIGAFERHLVTPGRFDTYLAGDATALTEAERKGLDTFVATGCTACHNGALLGGNSYMKLGQVVPYETEDVGRMALTGNEADKFMFKVPSLRNVAKTGPYFHDGKVATLDEAITLMGKHQLGKDLSADEVASIKTFLEALTGEIDTAFVAMPALPESGPETPGPVSQ